MFLSYAAIIRRAAQSKESKGPGSLSLKHPCITVNRQTSGLHCSFVTSQCTIFGKKTYIMHHKPKPQTLNPQCHNSSCKQVIVQSALTHRSCVHCSLTKRPLRLCLPSRPSLRNPQGHLAPQGVHQATRRMFGRET